MDINAGNIIEFISHTDGPRTGITADINRREIAQVNSVKGEWITAYMPDQTRVMLSVNDKDIKVIAPKGFAGWGSL